MTKKERIRIVVGATLNLVVFAISIYCFCYFLRHLIQGDADNKFRYFTNLSCLSAGLMSLISVVFLTISVIKGKIIYPKIVSILKMVAVSMVTLTFFTVLFVIAPLTSYIEMYNKIRFFTHLIGPIITMVSFLFFEEKSGLLRRFSMFSMVPFAIYSIVYVTNVVFLMSWPDLYKINTQGFWYLYLLAFYAGNFCITQGLYFLKKITNKIQ